MLGAKEVASTEEMLETKKVLVDAVVGETVLDVEDSIEDKVAVVDVVVLDSARLLDELLVGSGTLLVDSVTLLVDSRALLATVEVEEEFRARTAPQMRVFF